MPIRGKYGAVKDTFDADDYHYTKVLAPTRRPEFVDLERPGEPILDQGQLGSCWENAAAVEIGDQLGAFQLSRLWLYYKARVAMRTTHEDSGTASRPALQVLRKQGAAPEADWPYDVSKFTRQPPHKANVDAHVHLLDGFTRLRTMGDMLDSLAVGRSFMLGLLVTDEFESDDVASSGFVPMPKSSNIVGGHEMQVKGYRMGAQYAGGALLKLRNSWANDWGDRGYCYLQLGYLLEARLMMDAYVLDYSDDVKAAA